MDFKLIGSPCGQHGPYTFYKAFKYSKHGKTNILALSEFFFVKLWNDSDLVSIGELQLLWEDKNSEQTLASLRLYILPENTPEGRSDIHGEHEVLAITEKVVLRVEDLLSWITEAADWSWGLSAVYDKSVKIMPRPSLLADNSPVDLADVDKEKDLLGEGHWESKCGVVVLSYPGYCRYRGVLKRLEGVNSKWLHKALVVALGGFTVPCPNTRVLFCKDTFDYPDLEGHELLCNHLAPKLKGRPRKKRKLLDISQDSSDSDSSSESSSSSSTKAKYPSVQAHLSLNKGVSITARRPPRTQGYSEEREFLTRLYNFMKSRQTPINRLPSIGFKELDLYKMWTKVRHLGGYEAVTSSRLWKYVFEEVGGDHSNTSAATCCRRHYERLLLPYERHITPVRSKNTALAKLRKCDEISITTKSISNGRRESLQIKNGSLLRENGISPIELIDLASDDSPVKCKSDVIDLVTDSDDSFSPVKAKPTNNIAGKKQKLDILKEAGLEVTTVSTVANGRLLPAASAKPALVDKARPSVIQPPRPLPAEVKSRIEKGYGAKEKVSITITPDVNHILPKAHAWSNAVSNQNIYGNPKEVVRSDNRPSGGEVLDLRTKSSYTPIGSNLEITLVPPSSSANQSQNHYRPKKHPQLNIPTPQNRLKPYVAQPQRPMKPVEQRTTAASSVNVSNGRSSDIVPSVSISVNQKKKSKTGVAPQSSQAYPPYKANPYPMTLDPVYLSAFYGRLLTPYSPATPTQQVQLYKDLFNRHNIPDSFPRLLQDGSTSISLVNQTPSQPSK